MFNRKPDDSSRASDRPGGNSIEIDSRLRTILDALPVGVFVVDGNGASLYHNEPAGKIWGGEAPHAKDAEEYARYRGWWPESGQPLRPEEWGAARALDGETSVGEIINIQRFDNSRGTILNSAAPLRDQTGAIIGAVVIIQDVTESYERERFSSALADISAAINTPMDLEEITGIAFEGAARAIGSESATITLRHDDKWIVKYGYGTLAGIVGNVFDDEQVPHGVSALKTGETVVIDDAYTDPRVDQESVRRFEIRSVMVVPLIVRGVVWGLLNFNYHSEPVRFSPLQIDFAAKLASVVSLVLESTRLNIETADSGQAANAAVQRLEEVLDRMTDAIFAVDREWRFTFVSPQAEKMLLRSKEELLGKVVWDEFPEAEAFQSQYERAASEQRPASFRAYYAPLQSWFEARAYPSSSGMSVFFADVTEAVRAEQQRDELLAGIEQERRQLEAILQSLTEGVIIGDPEANVLDMNAEALQLHGFENVEQIRRGLKAFPEFDLRTLDGEPIPPDEWPLARVTRGERIIGLDLRVTNLATGLKRLWSYSGAPVYQDNKLIRTVLTVRDITETRELASERERLIAELQDERSHLHATQQELERELEATSRWLEAGRSLAGTLTLEEVTRAVAEQASKFTGASRVLVEVFRPGMDGLTIVDSRGRFAPPPGTFIAAEHISDAFRQAIKSGRTQLVDSEGANVPEGVAQLRERHKFRYYATVPLISGSEAVGAIVIDEPGERHDFTERQIAFLEGLAPQAATAIQNANLFQAETKASEEAKSSAETTSLLLEAAMSLAAATSLREVLSRLAQIALRFTGLPRAFVNLIDMNQMTLTPIVATGGLAAPGGGTIGFDKLSRTSLEAIISKKTAILDYEKTDTPDYDRGIAEANHSRLVLFVPLMSGGRLVGHISLDEPAERHDFSPREIELVEGIASQAALAISNAQLFDAERTAREQATHELEVTKLLLEAAGALNTLTDIDALLRGLADVTLRATPHSRVIIRLVSEDGAGVRLAASAGAFALPLGNFTTWERLSPPLRKAITEQRIEVVDYDLLPAAERGTASALKSHLSLVAPLAYGGRTLGFIRVDDPGERVPFTEREIEIVEGIASQASVAIENARHFEAQRGIAHTFQEALLKLPTEVAGIEFGHLYRSATEATRVGGDFYDIFDLNGGQVGILIGDVAGKGLDAATLTGVLKASIRAYVHEGYEVSEVITRANDLMISVGMSQPFVTLLFGILDVDTGVFRFTNAGHPYPAIYHSQAQAAELLAFSCPPVGAFAQQEYHLREVTLGPQDLLVLYTDGLTEARRGGELFGDERVLRAIEKFHGSSTQLLPRLIFQAASGYAGHMLQDDVAILAIRRSAKVIGISKHGQQP